MMEDEITFELTNYCPHGCSYCSSNTTNDMRKAVFLLLSTIQHMVSGKRFEHIILSGGEPLAHPQFYQIFNLCAAHTDDVVVYSNLIRHRAYNAQVIDGVYLEASITVTPETDKIRILKRIEQGKERHRPEVHFSRNHDEDCHCNNQVVRPDGTVAPSPCRKDENTNAGEGEQL